MSAPSMEAQASATGVAQEIAIQQIDGQPADPIIEGRLPSGVPLGGDTRLMEILSEVSGAWAVASDEPCFVRTPAPGESIGWLERARQARAYRRQHRLERHLASTSISKITKPQPSFVARFV